MNSIPPYMPFLGENGKFSVGLNQIEKNSWLDVDHEYPVDIKQKRVQTDRYLDYVFAQLPESEQTQGEVWDLFLGLLLKEKNKC